MFFSVIVPVYNVEKYLDQCLGCLVHQTYRDLEILVIDDGATDKSDSVYEKYASVDNRIKIIKQQNMGVSAARNTGLRYATGDWVHFMDSDDYLDLDYYEKMMAACRDIVPDILAGDVVSQNSNLYNVHYKSKVALFTKNEKFTQTNALNNCTIWRYVFRREFLVNNKLSFPVGRVFEDMLIMPNLILQASCILTVPGANYHYVFNEGSILNRPETPLRKQQYRYAENYIKQFAQKHNLTHVAERGSNSEVTIYKFLIFKFFKTEFNRNCNEKKYFLFGIRLFKKYIK